MDKELKFTETYFDDDRVDGIDKVTGKARYAAEHKLPNMAYAVFVCSTIAKGTIKNMLLSKAKNAPGVLDIIYYQNLPDVPGYKPYAKDPAKKGYEWRGLKVFTLLPFAIAIVVGVVYFQVHYAVDAVAGLTIAVLATMASSRLCPLARPST